MTSSLPAKRREYHATEIASYLKCGLMWRFRYVDGIKIPPRAALTVGRAVDAAISHNFAHKIQAGTDLAEDVLTDVCATEFAKGAPETEWLDGEDPGAEKDTAVACVKAHTREIAPAIQPASVQEKFVLSTDAGYDIGGTIDVTDKEDYVRDSKTSNKRYGDDSVATAIQPAVYDFAFEALRGRPARGFKFDVMIKPTKTLPARTQVIEGKPEREWLFRTIDQVDRAITAGIALPAAEGAWWCSKEWCGYGASGICPKFQRKLVK